MVHLSSWQRRFAAHLLLHRHSSALGSGPLAASAGIRTRVTIHRVGQRARPTPPLRDERSSFPLAAANTLCPASGRSTNPSPFLIDTTSHRKKQKKQNTKGERQSLTLSLSLSPCATTIYTMQIYHRMRALHCQDTRACIRVMYPRYNTPRQTSDFSKVKILLRNEQVLRSNR